MVSAFRTPTPQPVVMVRRHFDLHWAWAFSLVDGTGLCPRCGACLPQTTVLILEASLVMELPLYVVMLHKMTPVPKGKV